MSKMYPGKRPERFEFTDEKIEDAIDNLDLLDMLQGAYNEARMNEMLAQELKEPDPKQLGEIHRASRHILSAIGLMFPGVIVSRLKEEDEEFERFIAAQKHPGGLGDAK